MRLPPFLAAMRPHQWVKNLFVAAPLLFAKRLLDPISLGKAAIAVLVFCALSSAVYLINDLVDVERDRAHPKKKHRPIAAGTLSEKSARAEAAILAVLALAGAHYESFGFGMVALGYFGQNLLYSFVLKRIAYVDVFSIATGFLLRVYGGSLAISVPVSSWLIICTFSLALFLGLGKRRHELGAAVDETAAKAQRSSLTGYRDAHLRLAMALVGLVTIAAYTLYTLSPETQAQFHTRWLVVTVPMIAFGIYRFLWLCGHHRNAESPTEEMLKDLPFLLNVALWVLCVIGLIYGGHRLSP